VKFLKFEVQKFEFGILDETAATHGAQKSNRQKVGQKGAVFLGKSGVSSEASFANRAKSREIPLGILWKKSPIFEIARENEHFRKGQVWDEEYTPKAEKQIGFSPRDSSSPGVPRRVFRAFAINPAIIGDSRAFTSSGNRR
jgi:hypothetical protein